VRLASCIDPIGSGGLAVHAECVGQFVDIQTIFALFLILLSSVLSGLTDLSFTLNGYARALSC
jgi:hypothetical protein